jgi:hypothetical protein
MTQKERRRAMTQWRRQINEAHYSSIRGRPPKTSDVVDCYVELYVRHVLWGETLSELARDYHACAP